MASLLKHRVNITSKISEYNYIGDEKLGKLLENGDKVDNDEKIERCNFIKQFLRAISLGKYDMKLYTSRGKNTFSTSFGGIMTIIISLALLFYSVYVMIDIF